MHIGPCVRKRNEDANTAHYASLFHTHILARESATPTTLCTGNGHPPKPRFGGRVAVDFVPAAEFRKCPHSMRTAKRTHFLRNERLVEMEGRKCGNKGHELIE
jgi:hypothetical protein